MNMMQEHRSFFKVEIGILQTKDDLWAYVSTQLRSLRL